MKQGIAYRLEKLGKAIDRLSKRVYTHPVNPDWTRWFDDEGDKTHRLDYDLGAGSVVLDLGGYEGQWASDIFARFGCRVHVCEPVSRYVEAITRRFEHNDRITVHPVGVGGADATATIAIDGAASTVYDHDGPTETIRIVDVIAFLEEHGLTRIDLLKVNIEGGEYDLLERLVDSGRITDVRDIQVQFHDFFDDAEARMDRICEQLSKTHHPTYRYRFVWENWRRNDD